MDMLSVKTCQGDADRAYMLRSAHPRLENLTSLEGALGLPNETLRINLTVDACTQPVLFL